MRPESAVLLAVSNTQMTGLYGNVLPGMLTAIRSYVQQRDEYHAEWTAENLYGRHFRQENIEENRWRGEGGGIVFELLAEANDQLHWVFCFGHHISWYEHVFTLQMYKCWPPPG